jgi:hypothetical protein
MGLLCQEKFLLITKPSCASIAPHGLESFLSIQNTLSVHAETWHFIDFQTK